jgi:probable HAF family extracellular repeat protein
MSQLAKPDGDASGTAAINDSGQIVGSGQVSTAEYHALLWSNGELTDLGTLLGKKGNSFAVAINSHGLIIGTSDTRVDTRHAVAWENGRITDLGTLGGSESQAAAVNGKGQIAGTADNGRGRYGFPNRAVLWTLRSG